MIAHALTPILNVADIEQSFSWFESIGWKRLWDWGDPPSFGAVGSGACEIFLCLDGQGGRGRNPLPATGEFTASGDKGVWMSIWVDDVDAVHEECRNANVEVTFPPTDMPWHVREMHVRHPDGHVFRIGKGIEETGHSHGQA